MKDKNFYNLSLQFLTNGKEAKRMDIGINLDKVEHEDLLNLYNKTKDFVSYLENEIETVEVEKKTK